VILTGGASQLPGLCDIGQLILDKQVRVGKPRNVKGLAEATGGPAFSTAIGLLIYAAEHADEIPVASSSRSFSLPGPLNNPIVQKVTHWLKENW
jgi:cell division protein FtsA